MTGAAGAAPEAYARVRARLERADRIVLTTHVQPDGDGIGSQAALARFLADRGKRVTVLNPHPTPRRFRFLEPDPPFLAVDEADPDAILAGADLLAVLDISVPERLGRLGPHVREHAPDTLVIDHHVGPSRIPGLELRDPAAAATGELVWELLRDWGGGVGAEIATALYAAIAYDTGGFRYSNTTARTHEIAAELIRLGADTATANRWIFESASPARVRLTARVLGDLHLSDDGRLAWSDVPLSLMEEVGATSEDVEGLVEALRGVEGVEVAVLFKEVHAGATKVSFRSKGEADVNAFAGRFGGGGHRNASGALIHEPMSTVVRRVLPAALDAFTGNGRGQGAGGET